jgi:hypothetical protein
MLHVAHPGHRCLASPQRICESNDQLRPISSALADERFFDRVPPNSNQHMPHLARTASYHRLGRLRSMPPELDRWVHRQAA